MKNVRCTGGGSWHLDDWEPISTGPCGWTGERSHGRVRAVGDPVNPRYQTTVATAKPCPHCGGKVELIEREAAP